jgi:probable O-glycosylation ligase (exosortase A-associated)
MEKELTTKNSTGNWFLFILLYLVIDYGRPQYILPIAFLRLGVVIILILSFYVIKNRYRIDITSKQMKMIFLFILWLAILTPFAVNRRYAFNTTLTMMLFMPFILSVTGVVDTVDKLRKLIFTVVLLVGFVSAYSLFHKGFGTGNYFNDENDFALHVNMWLPFCYFLLFQEKSGLKRIIYGSCLVIGVLAVLVTFSRGGFLGLVCMMIVAWCYSPKKLVALLLFCILGVVVYYGFDLTPYIREMSTITGPMDATAVERVQSWKSAWAMFLDNPMGVGGNNFEVRFHEYQGEAFQRGMYGRVAHSLWFTLIPELGFIGIAIYVMLLYYNIRDIFSLKKATAGQTDELQYIHSLSLAFIAAFIGFFVSASFLSVLYYPHYWYLTGIIVATKHVYYFTQTRRTLRKV